MPCERLIQRLDAQHGVALVLLDARLRIEHVPGVGKARIVELQHESGVDDGAIFDRHRLGDRVEEFLGAR